MSAVSRAVGELLEGELAPAQDHDRRYERRHARRDHQHRCDHFERHGLAEHRRDAPCPGTGGIDDDGRPVGAGRRRDAPCAPVSREAGDGDAFHHPGAACDGLAPERLRRAERLGRAVAARAYAPASASGQVGTTSKWVFVRPTGPSRAPASAPAAGSDTRRRSGFARCRRRPPHARTRAIRVRPRGAAPPPKAVRRGGCRRPR